MIDTFAMMYVATHTPEEVEEFCRRIERHRRASNRFALIWFGGGLTAIAVLLIFIR